MRRSAPILAGLATLPTGALSFVTDMTLSWPKPHYENATAFDLDLPFLSGGEMFPCRSVAPPADVKRVPWPVAGTRIQLQRTSTLWNRTKDVDRRRVGTWTMRYSFGQFEGLDVGDLENPIFDLNSETWEPRDFEIGAWCTMPTDSVYFVSEDGAWEGSYDGTDVMVEERQLEGVNATLGIYMTQSSSSNFTGITQCVYVQFTRDAPRGPCKQTSYLPDHSQGDSDGYYEESSPVPEPLFTFNQTGLFVGLAIAVPVVGLLFCACYRSRKKSLAAERRRDMQLPRDRGIELQNKPPTYNNDEQLPPYSGAPPPSYDASHGAVGQEQRAGATTGVASRGRLWGWAGPVQVVT